MPNRDNFRVGFHAGTDLAAPGRAADPAGTFYWDPASAPDRLFIRVPNGSDVLVEQEIALAVAPGTPGAWGNYVVSNDPDVDAPYATIQAAAAAWAASGATSGVVLVLPGAYNLGGSLVVPDGLSIAGLGDARDDVVVTGTLSLAAPTRPRTFANFTLLGRVLGSVAADTTLRNVRVSTTVASALSVTGVPGATLRLAGSAFAATASGGSGVVRQTGGGALVLENTDVAGAAGAVGVFVSLAGGTARLSGSRLTGAVSATSAQVEVGQGTSVDVDGTAAFVRNAGALFVIGTGVRARRTGVAGPLFSNTGVASDLAFAFQDVAFDGDAVVSPPGRAVALPTLRPYTRTIAAAGAAVLTYPDALPDVLLVDATVGPTVNLPAAATVPDGTRLTVRSAARPAGGAITVATPAGEVMDYGVGTTRVLTPTGGNAIGATFQYDRAATPPTWFVVNYFNY